MLSKNGEKLEGHETEGVSEWKSKAEGGMKKKNL